MHLINVDFPAPLSPTSAVTLPAVTEKSTACRTSTAPKLLFTPRISRIGLSATVIGASPALVVVGGRARSASTGTRPLRPYLSRKGYLTPAAVHLATYA